MPTTAELDAVLGARPAYLARVDVHSALASTALREQAPGLDAADGYDGAGPLSADAHHRVRAAARALLSARSSAPRPAPPRSTRSPPRVWWPCTSAQAPTSAASTTGGNCEPHRTASR